MELSNAFVVVAGLAVVFIGLTSLILICYLMSLVVNIIKSPDSTSEKTDSAQTSDEIPNKSEFIAAVSAAISEYSGTDAKAIKILKVKKI